MTYSSDITKIYRIRLSILHKLCNSILYIGSSFNSQQCNKAIKWQLMKNQIIKVEADSLQEAKELVRTQIPEGFHLLTEQVISNGRHKTARGVSDTLEDAHKKAKTKVTAGADIIEIKEESFPKLETIVIEAYDELTAKMEAKQHLRIHGRVKGVLSMTPGKKILFGISRKPNSYEIQAFYPAIVEITYREKAKIHAIVGDESVLKKHKAKSKKEKTSDQGKGYKKWQSCRFGEERIEGQLGSFIVGACCTNSNAARNFGMMKWSSFIKLTAMSGQRGKSPFSTEAYVLAPGANCRECSKCYFYTTH